MQTYEFFLEHKSSSRNMDRYCITQNMQGIFDWKEKKQQNGRNMYQDTY